jgi:hypothetical protein
MAKCRPSPSRTIVNCTLAFRRCEDALTACFSGKPVYRVKADGNFSGEFDDPESVELFIFLKTGPRGIYPLPSHITLRAVRLLELCEAEGFQNIDELLEASICDSVCRAICMECGCTAEMEPDQRAVYCEQCGQNKVVSCLILVGLI